MSQFLIKFLYFYAQTISSKFSSILAAATPGPGMRGPLTQGNTQNIFTAKVGYEKLRKNKFWRVDFREFFKILQNFSPCRLSRDHMASER